MQSTPPLHPGSSSLAARRHATAALPSQADLSGLRAQVCGAQERRSSQLRDAASSYQSARAKGPLRAFELGGKTAHHESFVKFRETGGVDLMALDIDPDASIDQPELEHLYWRRETPFRTALCDALRDQPEFPPIIGDYAPTTEALLTCLQNSEIPVQTLVAWMKKNSKPVSVPTPGEVATTPSWQPTHEMVLYALDYFKTQGAYPAYALVSADPRCQGLIKVMDDGCVNMLVVNDSHAREAHEPQVTKLFWRDPEALRQTLYEGLNVNAGCPQPVDGEGPTLDAMLAFLQERSTPLESFIKWAADETALRKIVGTAENMALPDAPKPASKRSQAMRKVIDPVRLVDHVNEPVAKVLACAQLRGNIGDECEDWVYFRTDESLVSANMRARFESAHKRIRVDVGAVEQSISIYLNAGCNRVVGITGDPDLEQEGWYDMAAAGLLDSNFACVAAEPRAMEFHLSIVSGLGRVSKEDVNLVRKLNSNPGPRAALSWDATGKEFRLPRHLHA